jgi:hypothetical protein
MYNDLLVEYEHRRTELRTKGDTARKELTELTKPLTHNIIKSIESDVTLIHEN